MSSSSSSSSSKGKSQRSKSKMAQQTVDSSICKHGCSDNGSNMTGHDEQVPLVKETALPEVQNENGIAYSTGNSLLPVDKGQAEEAAKATGMGTKRPSADDSASIQRHQLANCNPANANLVYVRRKTEAEVCKSPMPDERSMNFDCPSSGHLGHAEETMLPKEEMIEPKADTKSLTPELKHQHVPPSGLLSNGPKGIKHLSWQERYHHLQNLLNKLDESDQGDYVQMLRSLSSVELSRHAVQLETRSIQLSLEEAREVHRVGILNVLGGRATSNFKAPAVRQSPSEKQRE